MVQSPRHPAAQAAPPPLLAGLHALFPWLDRDDIGAVLAELNDDAEKELATARDCERRRDALLAEIPEASGYPHLHRLHRDLNDLEMERFLRYGSVPLLHESCTAYRDALVDRALQLVGSEIPSPPPAPFALLSMGSDGREEQTLITDQDYLLVYDDTDEEGAEGYFASFSELLVDRLEEIGFKKCTGDIMPSNRRWRGSITQWVRRVLAMVRYEIDDYSRNVMDLIILSDARCVAGDRELAAALVREVRILERDYFQALWGMAKAASEMKVALTFLKRIWTEGSGEHRGEFNLKLLGWAPLVMNVRILAINQGVAATNTVQRIEALNAEGSLSAEMAAGLSRAYRTLTGHRVQLQAGLLRGERRDAYYLDPDALAREEREELRQALHLVEELQKMIRTNFLVM